MCIQYVRGMNYPGESSFATRKITLSSNNGVEDNLSEVGRTTCSAGSILKPGKLHMSCLAGFSSVRQDRVYFVAPFAQGAFVSIHAHRVYEKSKTM